MSKRFKNAYEIWNWGASNPVGVTNALLDAVREKQEYGDVVFYIQANTLKELQSAIVRSERVTQRWINKYRVNSMSQGDM